VLAGPGVSLVWLEIVRSILWCALGLIVAGWALFSIALMAEAEKDIEPEWWDDFM